jgi:epoxyqueuosine reductase
MHEPISTVTLTDEDKSVIKNEILALDLIKDVGFASISAYERVPGGSTPSEFLSDAKTAVVYLVKLDDVLSRFGKFYAVCLSHFLRQADEKVVNILKRHHISSRGVIDERGTGSLVGKISFRQLAVLAGLGTIGKNTCLIHPIHGPNVLIGVILTNSSIPCDYPLHTEPCFHCDICIRECRTGALQYDHIDRYTCKRKRTLLGKNCGTLCINMCPHG